MDGGATLARPRATSDPQAGYVQAGQLRHRTTSRPFYLYRADADDGARVGVVEALNASEATRDLFGGALVASLPLPHPPESAGDLPAGQEARVVCSRDGRGFLVGSVHWPRPARRTHAEVQSSFPAETWERIERLWDEMAAEIEPDLVAER